MAVYIWPPKTISTLPPVGGATAAKQDTGNTSLNNIDTNIGAKADAVATTDTGTFSLIALVKKINQSFTSLITKITDGSQITKITDGTGTVNTKQLGTAVTNTDVGLVTNTVIHGLTTGGGGSFVDVKVTPSGALVADVTSNGSAVATEATALNTYNEIVTFGNESNTNQLVLNDLVGLKTETAPTTDTASSGLNGRLQRIAQRLTSLIALLPSSIGQKASTDSLSVVVANDQVVKNQEVSSNGTDPFSTKLITYNAQSVSGLSNYFSKVVTGIVHGWDSANSVHKEISVSSTGQVNTASTQQTVAGTITNAQVTVGLTAVRATVSGSAPNAARKKLIIKPSASNTGKIFLGASSVTIANGLEIIGPDRLEFEFDSGDYYLISDTTAQAVEIIEKA